MKKDQSKSWLSWEPLEKLWAGVGWGGRGCVLACSVCLCDGRVMMAYFKGASLKTQFAPSGRSVHTVLKVWSLDQQHQNQPGIY